MAGNKPKPPPLDDEQANPSNAAVPQAESGKATEDDAKAADAREAAAARLEQLAALRASIAAPPAAPPAPGLVDFDDAVYDGSAGAVISQRSGQFVARPDPTKPLSLTEAVVHGNWVGRYHDDEGQPCPAYVKHGTPLDGLPSDLVRQIAETRGQVLGPLPPKAATNPFTP